MGNNSASSHERTTRRSRTVRLLMIPGAVLTVVGFILTVVAYAGRDQGIVPLAFGGVLLLFVGICLCFAGVITLIARNVSDDDYRVVRGARICPSCGKQAGVGKKFCPYCGKALPVLGEGESIEATPATEAAAPASAGAGTPQAANAPGPASAEQVLLSFGPFGTDICNGPFRAFSTWHRRNSMTVELTNLRLCVLPNKRFGLLSVPAMKYPWGTRLPLEIPYNSIVSVELQKHPSPIALMEVLDIKYNEGGIVQEKSIASYTDTIRRAYDTLVAARQALSERPAAE